MRSTAHIFLYLLFASVLLCTAGRALAVDNYVPLTPIQYTFPVGAPTDCEQRADTLTKLSQSGNKSAGSPYDNARIAYKACKTSLPSYLRGVYTMGVVVAGFLAVFSIVRGGFTLLYTDSILGHSEAKGIILRAVGGLLIVYMSYIFLNQLNPQLAKDLDLALAFPQVEVKKGLFNNFLGGDSSRTDTAMNQRLLREQLVKLDKATTDRRKREIEGYTPTEGPDKGKFIPGVNTILAEADELTRQAANETDPVKKAALTRQAELKTAAAYKKYAIDVAGHDALQQAQVNVTVQTGKEPNKTAIAETVHQLRNVSVEYGNAALKLHQAGLGGQAADIWAKRVTDISAVNKNIASVVLDSSNPGSSANYDIIKERVAAIRAEGKQAVDNLAILRDKGGYADGSPDKQRIIEQINRVNQTMKASICSIKTHCVEKTSTNPNLHSCGLQAEQCQ